MRHEGSRVLLDAVRSTAPRVPAHRLRWLSAVLTGAVFATVPLTVAVASRVPDARPAHSTASARSATPVGSWTTYGGSMLRWSSQPDSPSLLGIRERWTSPVLDGAVYGEPLISGNRVYVATEADVVYALNASSGAVIWSRTLGVPVPASVLPCGDISPTVGVTSTMVLDPATGRLFASGSIDTGGVVQHELFGLSPANGRIVLRRDLDQPGWTASAELQRNGLGLDGDEVLIGFGGNDGDCGTYNGYLMGVPVSGVGSTRVFKVATGREGAIWAPSGVAVDASGKIYLATGNGSSRTTLDEGDSVIELDRALRQVSFFTPTAWLEDNATDGDLGSTSPILVGGGDVFIVGKEMTGYLLRAGALGGLGGELASATVCFSTGGNAYRNSVVYVACPHSGITAVRVAHNTITPEWTAPTGDAASPTIAGGAIWTVDSGRLVGLAFGSGAPIASAPVIPTEHFAAPSAGDGLLVVGGDDAVEAFEGASGYAA